MSTSKPPTSTAPPACTATCSASWLLSAWVDPPRISPPAAIITTSALIPGKPRRFATPTTNDRAPSPHGHLPNLRQCSRRTLLLAGIALDGASDHGVSHALYLRDPDRNGVELYWDTPTETRPLTRDGKLAMVTRTLDLHAPLAEAPRSPETIGPARPGLNRGIPR